MQHSLVSPRCEQRSDNIFLPLSDDQIGALVFGIIARFFHQLIFQLLRDQFSDLPTSIRFIEIFDLWEYS